MGQYTTQTITQYIVHRAINLHTTLEALAPLHLAKQHLPEDIIDILERLGKSR